MINSLQMWGKIQSISVWLKKKKFGDSIPTYYSLKASFYDGNVVYLAFREYLKIWHIHTIRAFNYMLG